MSTSTQITYTRHGGQRKLERGVSDVSIAAALRERTPVRQANDTLVWVGPDGLVVITDLSGAVIVTVLGKRERAPHDRPGAGRSRHVRNRKGPKSRPRDCR